MKNLYSLPNYPAVVGRYHDQDSFAHAAYELIKRLVEKQSNDHFGVVRCGMGGGYFVDWAEDVNSHVHPIELCVYLVNPENAALKTLADVAEQEWSGCTAESVNAESEVEGWDCRKVEVKWCFETMEEAKVWVQNHRLSQEGEE